MSRPYPEGDPRPLEGAEAPGGTADAALLGRALGDPLRLAILERLVAGAAAVSDLVAATGASQPNVSNHLAVLRSAGLVRQTRRGRSISYELAGPAVAQLVEALMLVAHPAGRLAEKVTPALAQARTCYDHLAGALGVSIFDALVEAAAIVPPTVVPAGRPRPLGREADASLGPNAREVFAGLGIDLVAVRRSSRRRLAPVCLDWTELRPHLGGALGAALYARFVSEGWVVPQPGTRAVIVTPVGRDSISAAFGRP